MSPSSLSGPRRDCGEEGGGGGGRWGGGGGTAARRGATGKWVRRSTGQAELYHGYTQSVFISFIGRVAWIVVLLLFVVC